MIAHLDRDHLGNETKTLLCLPFIEELAREKSMTYWLTKITAKKSTVAKNNNFFIFGVDKPS